MHTAAETRAEKNGKKGGGKASCAFGGIPDMVLETEGETGGGLNLSCKGGLLAPILILILFASGFYDMVACKHV